MRLMLQALAALIALGCSALAVQAGVALQMKESKPGSEKPGQLINMYIDAGKLRIDIGEHGGKKTAMIFNQAKQVMWMIDHSDGSYMEITAADLQRIKQQLDSAMKQMKAMMANIPPEQRKMVEKMMKQKMGMGKPPSITMQVKSRGEKVGRYVCTLYEVLSDGQRIQEIWAAPIAEAQLGETEYQTFRAMAEFFEPPRSSFAQGGWQMPGHEDMEGFPVRWLEYKGDRVVAEWETTKAERKALESSLFTVPPGLKKQKMPTMPR